MFSSPNDCASSYRKSRMRSSGTTSRTCRLSGSEARFSLPQDTGGARPDTKRRIKPVNWARILVLPASLSSDLLIKPLFLRRAKRPRARKGRVAFSVEPRGRELRHALKKLQFHL